MLALALKFVAFATSSSDPLPSSVSFAVVLGKEGFATHCFYRISTLISSPGVSSRFRHVVRLIASLPERQRARRSSRRHALESLRRGQPRDGLPFPVLVSMASAECELGCSSVSASPAASWSYRCSSRCHGDFSCGQPAMAQTALHHEAKPC